MSRGSTGGLRAARQSPKPAARACWSSRDVGPEALRRAVFSSNFLINTAYREKIAGEAGWQADSFVIPCLLSREAGYVRGWFARVNGLQTIVNARRARAEERAHSFNGVVTEIFDDRLLRGLDDGRFVELDRAHLEPLGWQNLPPVPIYIFEADHNDPPDIDFPILQSGVDLVIEGCLEHGEAFAVEFLETSGCWSRYWLDDRELPRRPWVHQPRARQIDQLLAKHPRDPARNRFRERRLDTAYAQLFVDERATAAEELALPNPELAATGRLLSPPRHFIFGFGSLINTKSRRSSNPDTVIAVPVRLEAAAGFTREWISQSPTAKLTALGVALDAETSCSINGVVYPCEDIESFDEREVGYTRVELPREHLTFVSWKAIPADARVWIYVPDGPGAKGPGEGLSPASFDYPILQTYVDVCVLGALEYGREFALEFIRTVRGWSKFWLNDRPLARRPWVHQPRYKEIDALLLEAFGAEAFKRRRLDVEYGLLGLARESAS